MSDQISPLHVITLELEGVGSLSVCAECLVSVSAAVDKIGVDSGIHLLHLFIHLEWHHGTRDCRYFAGLFLFLPIVLLPAIYGGSISGFYQDMLSTVCLVTASILFFFFVLTKTILGLCILDSIGFSLLAFMEICVIYSKYVAYVPIQIVEVIGALLPVYLIIYVIYRLVVWMKALQVCKKKHKDQLIPETEEPDRLTHPENYETDEPTLLLPDNQDYPQYPELETYPVCGNSRQKYGSV